MKTPIACVTILCMSATCFSQVKLPDETPVKVKITKQLSSRQSQAGDVVYFKLKDNIMVDSVVVIDTTAEVIGEVIEAGKARSLGRPGKLDFTINSVKATDGQNIKLRATAKRMLGADKTGGVVAAAVLFTPVALFIKGKDVTINAGKEFIVYVDRDYLINKK